MKDKDKQKEQFINEIVKLRQRNAELEDLENEHKRSEEALKDSEERFHRLFDSVPVGISVAKIDGTILAYNNTLSKVSGYSMGELSKFNVLDSYENPDDRELLIKQFKKDGFVRV